MDNITAWALLKAKDIVDCEGSALVSSTSRLRIQDMEADTTLLAMAISEALVEAFALGLQVSATAEDEQQ
jgi:hypothetical protein